jgi:predicted negative regulator of RcsB-dependent stress response
MKQADQLRSTHPKSPYADQADLALARAAVDARDFDGAAKRLRAVADGSRDPQLRIIARTRLARVLGEQGKHDEALALLEVSEAGAFTALLHDIRGDLFAAKGDVAAAAREYDAVLAGESANAESGIDRVYVQLKREALAVPAASPAAAPVADTAPVPQP